MKVIIASDHAGFDHKDALLKDIQQQGYDVTDIGTFNKEADDYPDRAAEMANAILSKKGDKGIIICGSGVGVSVAVIVGTGVVRVDASVIVIKRAHAAGTDTATMGTT